MSTEIHSHQTNKATRIKLLSFSRPHMRTFHMTWFAFFLVFFGRFGIAPLMALVRDDLGLTRSQMGNTIIEVEVAKFLSLRDSHAFRQVAGTVNRAAPFPSAVV